MGFVTIFWQILLLLVPVGMSVAGVVWDCIPLFPIAALILLALVRTLPLCRGDEVPWTVLFSAPVGLPVNLIMVRFLWQSIWWDAPLWARILRGLLALYVLFSVETLILSLLARLFRRTA